MSEKALFESMYRVTVPLKGGPLKPFEKDALINEFYKANGTNFEKAKTAIARVLHTDTSYIYEKTRIYKDMAKLLDDIKREADNLP